LQRKLQEQEQREKEMAEREQAARKRQEELEAKLAAMEHEDDDEEVEQLKAELAKQKADAEAVKAELVQQKEQFDAALASEDGGAELVARRKLQSKLQAQSQAVQSLTDDDISTAQNAAMEKQRKEYAARGIALAHFDADTELPHFANIDQDPFRHMRFLFLVKKPRTVFGSNEEADVKPFSFSVQPNHATVTKDENGNCTLVSGAGEVYHNGKLIKEGEAVALTNYDRVAIGTDLLLFKIKAQITETSEEPTADFCLGEYRKGSRSQEEIELEKRMAEFEAQKKKWDDAQKNHKLSKEQEEKRKKDMEKLSMEVVNKEIMQLLPLTKEAKLCCDKLCREMLSFEVLMQRSQNKEEPTPTVKVKVHREGGSTTEKQDILIETFEFERGLSTIRDEVRKFNFALSNSRTYTSPVDHDPIKQFMDRTMSTTFWKYFIENFHVCSASENKSYAKWGKIPHKSWGFVHLNQAASTLGSSGPNTVKVFPDPLKPYAKRTCTESRSFILRKHRGTQIIVLSQHYLPQHFPPSTPI
jgi:hypothetical protein